MGDFQRDIPLIFAHEGGAKTTDYPHDPGGLTQYGLSKRANPDLDIGHLTEAQAATAYDARYWTPAGCQALPEPLALNVFDAAVNLGVPGAKVLLGVPGIILPRAAEDFLWARIARYQAITAANIRKVKIAGRTAGQIEADKAAEYAKFYGWVSRCLLVRHESATT